MTQRIGGLVGTGTGQDGTKGRERELGNVRAG